MAVDVKIGTFKGYSDSSTSYGYYFIYFGYDSVERNATSVTFKNARFWGQQQGTGYTTNTVYLDQCALNDINMSTSWSGKGSSYSSWSAGWKDMTVTGINGSTTSIKAQFWMHRTGQSWGAQYGEGSIGINQYTIWNDINVLSPSGAQDYASGYFDLYISANGKTYTNLTNETDTTQPYGSYFEVYNIRPYYDYYQLSSVSGHDSTPNGRYRKVFDGANEVLTIQMGYKTYYRDINAYQPDGSTQNGVKFKYTIKNRSGTAVYNSPEVTNEVADTVTREYNYTGTLTVIGSNVTGAHYTKNNITNDGSTSFSWTYNNGNAICLYTAWNTYTVKFNANGGTGTTADQGFTYNTAQNLRSNGFSRSGYDFLGWSTSSTATTATYSNGQSVNNLTTTHGGTVTLYAVWRETKPSNVQLTGTVTGPFGIDLSYSSTGVNVSYTIYYKKSTESTYTSVSAGSATSKSLSVSEETTYNIYIAATNKGGTTNSSTITLTTPADQAKIRIKKDGAWKKGKTYYKKDGVWVKAKKLYIKIDGKWVINTNYDPGEKK